MLLVVVAVLATATAHADRPDTPGTTELFRYAAGDVVDTYSPAASVFAVHYTRSGVNAVPGADTDGSGVPDHVERVAAIYDEVLAFYRDTLGYRAPLDDGAIAINGGDARFDVYLLDFGGSADGSFRTDACGAGGAPARHCIGFMVQENDFAGYGYPTIEYANRVLASHELFHAVQAAYDSEENSVLREGTAVWATEAFDPSLRDLEGFAGGYLEHTDRPIDRPLPGPVDPFSYGSGIFFQYLSEQFDRDLIRALWEATESDDWLPALGTVLTTSYAQTFAEAFREFTIWNLYTADRADPAVAYAGGAGYPRVTVENVFIPHAATGLRIFPASARYYAADPSPRSTIIVELVAAPADLEVLDVVAALRTGSTITIAPDPAAVVVGGADQVIAIVLSTATTGESRRPGLCIGDAAEVAACRAAMMPAADAGPTPETDAGPVPPPDAGPPDDPPAGDDGCGCRTPGAGRHRSGAGALLVLLALVARLRGRRV